MLMSNFDYCPERTSNQAEGGARGTSTGHAGDCATHRQSLQRVQVANGRRRIRPVVQSRAHGRRGPMVPRSIVRRHLQGKCPSLRNKCL